MTIYICRSVDRTFSEPRHFLCWCHSFSTAYVCNLSQRPSFLLRTFSSARPSLPSSRRLSSLSAFSPFFSTSLFSLGLLSLLLDVSLLSRPLFLLSGPSPSLSGLSLLSGLSSLAPLARPPHFSAPWLRPCLVGITGFEPVTPCSQSRCANRTAPHPVVLTLPQQTVREITI